MTAKTSKHETQPQTQENTDVLDIQKTTSKQNDHKQPRTQRQPQRLDDNRQSDMATQNHRNSSVYRQ